MGRDIRDEQRALILKAIELGKRMQDEHPEIAEELKAAARDRRTFKTRKRIVLEHNLGAEYRSSLEVLMLGVYFFAAGNRNEESLGPQYDGVLTDEELEAYRSNIREQNGRRSYRNGLGIHAMSSAEHAAIGNRAYEQRTGIHGLSDEERSVVGRIGGKASARAAGKHVWYTHSPYEPSPLRRLEELARDKRFYAKGRIKRIKAEEIAAVLTAEFPDQPQFDGNDVKHMHYLWKDRYSWRKAYEYDILARLPKIG